MSDRSYRRLTRYAAYSAVHLLLVIGVLAGGVRVGAGGLTILVASLPLLWAWGAFQADVELNGWLDDADRSVWRIALWLVPWLMTAYWYRYVRPRRIG